MRRSVAILKRIFRSYLIYIFIFAVLIFAIQTPIKKEKKEPFFNKDYDFESRKEDRVALIESPEAAAIVRLNLIENAEHTLDISYYTLIKGRSTDVFLSSIVAAANRGVKVRVLLDGIFNSLSGELKDTIYGFYVHPNIDLKFYEPFKALSPITWNNRLHDKIIIADENLALIGGRNIGDKYFLQDLMKEDYVKDRDVIIYNEKVEIDSPSVIDDMKAYYNQLWNYRNAKTPRKTLKARHVEKGKAFNEKSRKEYISFQNQYGQDNNHIDWYKNTIATESIKFVHNPIGIANQDPWCLREILDLASEAKESVILQSPYIIPSRNMRSKLSEYDIDFEKVIILTNSLASSPNPFAIAGYSNRRKIIVDTGMKVLEYQGPESIHGKTYIIDDSISIIGSFNFDARSSYINSESMVVITSKEFTNILKEEVQIDMDNSLRVSKDYSYLDKEDLEEKKVSIFKRGLIFFLSKISLFLEYLL